MARQVQATIDIDALRHNFVVAKSYAGEACIIAVIKANAYGHGAIEVARALDSADMLGVASLEEAVELRLAGIDKPMLLLSGFHEAQDLYELDALNLQTVIHNSQQLQAVTQISPKGALKVWLKMDTGMHRLGFSPEQMGDAFTQLSALPHIEQVSLMSHFATADDTASPFTLNQLKCFNDCTSGLDAPVSLCNSAALIAQPAARKEWVRPGIMLYGGNPFVGKNDITNQLKPVMTFHSKIVGLRTVAAGESTGYGQCWVASRQSVIGTVAVGYGDGYPRHAPNGTPVLVRGKFAPLAGTVSMDLIGVDLTDIPEAQVGDKAILWGEGLPVEKIAACSGTINYQLLTGVSKRVPRQYLLSSN